MDRLVLRIGVAGHAICRNMHVMTKSHPTEDMLEQCAMGQLNEPELVPLEEHLLVCPCCCDRVAFLDKFIGSIRAAGNQTTRPAAGGRPH